MKTDIVHFMKERGLYKIILLELKFKFLNLKNLGNYKRKIKTYLNGCALLKSFAIKKKTKRENIFPFQKRHVLNFKKKRDNFWKLLIKVDIWKNGKAVVKTKFDQNYSSAVSSILFLENNELLVGAMWEGIVYYGQIESGLDNGIFVEGQFFF